MALDLRKGQAQLKNAQVAKLYNSSQAAEIGGPEPLLNLTPFHRNVIFAIENHFSLAKWPPLLSVASSASVIAIGLGVSSTYCKSGLKVAGSHLLTHWPTDQSGCGTMPQIFSFLEGHRTSCPLHRLLEDEIFGHHAHASK